MGFGGIHLAPRRQVSRGELDCDQPVPLSPSGSEAGAAAGSRISLRMVLFGCPGDLDDLVEPDSVFAGAACSGRELGSASTKGCQQPLRRDAVRCRSAARLAARHGVHRHPSVDVGRAGAMPMGCSRMRAVSAVPAGRFVPDSAAKRALAPSPCPHLRFDRVVQLVMRIV